MVHISTNKTPKFIYFDIGDVLLEWKPWVHKLSELTGVAHEQILDSFMPLTSEIAARGKITGQKLWQDLADCLNVSPSLINNFFDFCVSYMEPVQPTHELAHQLSQKYKIGLLSNIEQGLYELLEEENLVPGLAYHAVIKSCDVGLIKPEAEIYAHAEKEAGAQAAEIFFIDNMEKNVTAALNRGWRGLVFDESNPRKSVEKIRQILL